MKERTIKFNDDNEINITPMMDVVFIMLIFFIVSTSFVKEKGLGISQANSQPPPSNQTEIATIKLHADGHTINGQQVSLDGIKSRLSQLKAAKPELKAQLFSANEIKIDTLVRAMEQIKAAKVNDFSVSAY